MIIHEQKLVYIDRHAGGPLTPELIAAGRAKAPGLQATLAREAEAASATPPLPLGDLVERYAKPVAILIDRSTAKLPAKWRTRLAWCGGCSARQIALNEWLPDVKSGVAWWGAAGRVWRLMQAR